MKKNILFVCKYNRFRSKVAEALFKKYNKNPNIKVKSAGIIRGNPIDNSIKEAGKEIGIKIQGNPKGISEVLLRWSDLMIIVADDVSPSIFSQKYVKKKIVWKIQDTNGGKESIHRVMIKIKKRMENFIKHLK